MDVMKVKAAIATAQNEVQFAVSAAAKAAEKNPIEVNAIAPLVKAAALLSKAQERIALAVEKATPKPKEDKKKK